MGREKRVGKGQGERRSKPSCRVAFRKTFLLLL